LSNFSANALSVLSGVLRPLFGDQVSLFVINAIKNNDGNEHEQSTDALKIYKSKLET
jgi:hypothetical protein